MSIFSRFKFEGYVSDCDKEQRVILTKNRQRGTQEDKHFVMDAVLFGSTGPVTVALWGNTCIGFLEILRVQPVNPIIYFMCLRFVTLPRNEGTVLYSRLSVNCSHRIRMEATWEHSPSM